MASRYLDRDGAPFESDIWSVLDETMQEAAKNQLVGRRLLNLKGPFGLGLKAVPVQDQQTESGMIVSSVRPVYLIQKSFALGTRDLANYERNAVVLDTTAVVETTSEIAQLEDRLIFHGAQDTPGLLNVEGSCKSNLGDWSQIGAAADDVIGAMTTLDDAGFHGPYCLALAPRRYNLLFRLYPQGKRSELDHLKTIVSEGIYKTPILESGGVLLASTVQCASIILGQDMQIGYIGPEGDGEKQMFSISESLTVMIRRPQAICVLEA